MVSQIPYHLTSTHFFLFRGSLSFLDGFMFVSGLHNSIWKKSEEKHHSRQSEVLA